MHSSYCTSNTSLLRKPRHLNVWSPQDNHQLFHSVSFIVRQVSSVFCDWLTEWTPPNMCVMPCFIQLTSIIKSFRSYLAETDTDRNQKTALEIIFLYSRLDTNKFEISFCVVWTLHERIQMEVTGKQSFQSFQHCQLSDRRKKVRQQQFYWYVCCITSFLQLHEVVSFLFSIHTLISNSQPSLHAHNTHSCLQSL